MTRTVAVNRQIESLANMLSAERDAVVQYIVHADANQTSLDVAYASTDRQLSAVRSKSAWPQFRPGDPPHVAGVEEFRSALRDVRNRTLTTARSPHANVSLASLFIFYVDVNEFLLVSVAKTTQVVTQSFVFLTRA